MNAEIKAYNAARDAVLLTRDVAKFTAWAAEQGQQFSHPIVAEIALHKMRTAAVSLPIAERRASKTWLTTRGYESFDDGDL